MQIQIQIKIQMMELPPGGRSFWAQSEHYTYFTFIFLQKMYLSVTYRYRFSVNDQLFTFEISINYIAKILKFLSIVGNIAVFLFFIKRFQCNA